MNAARLSQVLFVGLALFFTADTRRYEAPAPPPKRDRASALTELAKQPLRFEENVGQSTSDARFVARRAGVSLFLSDGGATLALSSKDKHAELTLSVDGGRKVTPVASEPLPTKTNYLVGRDKSKWHTNVDNYAKVTYADVLDGVDVVYHGEEGQLEYDFVVAPGADVAHVAMNIGGTAKLTLTEKGDLEIGVNGGTLVQPKPRVYQRDERGVAHDVDASYRLVGNRRVGFEVASYDRKRPLVIDPVIGYSTYLGQSDGNTIAIAQDSAGNAFIVGTAPMHDFSPSTTIGGFCARTPSDARCTPQSVVATAASGSVSISWSAVPDALSYNLYRSVNTPGGEGTTPYQSGLTAIPATDNGVTNGTIYYYTVAAVTTGGTTNQSAESAPVTPQGPEQPEATVPDGAPNAIAQPVSNDIFVAKLADSGSLTYFTYIGGPDNDNGSGVAVDSQGLPVVVGGTDGNDFPTTTTSQYGSTLQGPSDGVVFQLNGAGSDLVFSTRVGQDQQPCSQPEGLVTFASCNTTDTATSVALSGNTAYVAGTSSCSECSPTGFIASVPFGSNMSAFSQIGGDSANGVAVDAGGVYVVGSASSDSVNGISSPNSYISTTSNNQVAFLVKLTVDGNFTPLWGTYFGDPTSGDFGSMSGAAVALGAQGHAYITGAAACAWSMFAQCNFPMRSAFQPNMGDAGDAFVAHFNTNLTGDASLVYATFLGGNDSDQGNAITLDPLGHAFVAGWTRSTSFPVANAPAKTTTDQDAFITELDATGASLVLSATFGGAGSDATTGISYNATGVVISGNTSSDQTTFPLSNAVQQTYSGDSGNDAFAAKFRVLAPLDLQPASSNIAANASLVFTASGGSGTGYSFTLSVNGSGATINPGTGAYTAGPNSGTDLIRVADLLGNSASALVVVTATATVADLVISPTDASVTPRGNLAFSATGGTPPYFFDFLSNASIGTISDSGLYVAGMRGSVIDTVRVTDQAGLVRQATVRVGPAISITPNGVSVAAGGTTDFRASGGAGAYQWSASAGTITSSGSFTAPTTATAVTITVRDTLGNTASASVSVGGAIVITPGGATTYPRGTVHFQALGGSGEGFKWIVASGTGTIDVGSGDYTAGAQGNTQDAIEVTDSNGNKASAVITIGPGLTISPPSTTANANAQVHFSAAGGSGAGYAFAMISAPSGGSISQQGIYTAGKSGGNDLIKVTDSAGNSAQAQVTAAAAPASTSSSSSTSSTSGSGAPGTGVPDVDAGDGSNLALNVGKSSGSNSSCTIGRQTHSTDREAILAILFGLALVTRRQTRRART